MAAEEQFNVVVWDVDGYWRYAEKDVSAERAVNLAKLLSLAAESEQFPDGAEFAKVMITDSGDMTNFLWERGKGIVFPKEEVEQ